MDLKLQRIGAWSGIAMMVLLGIFFVFIAKLVPPLSPTSSPQEIAQFFIDNKLRVRLGIALTLFGACLGLPFFAAICLRIRRVEGNWGMLSVTQIFAGIIFVPGLIFPLMFLAAAAFRPEQRAPELTQALNDVFWLIFVGIVGTLVVQALVLATASFFDRTDPQTFPRWFGYFNVWYAMLAVPGGAVVIFNDGPLAWNGVFAFWIPLGVFSVWAIVTSMVMLRSISAQEATATQLTTTAS